MLTQHTAAPSPVRKIGKRRRLVVDEVITQLQNLLSSGQYKTGDKIPPEAELGGMLGVSRTTIREAVKVLSKAGLLEVQQGRGTFVSRHRSGKEPLGRRLSRASMQEVYEVRQLLDIGVAKLAALHRTDDDLRHMRECLEARNEAQKRGDHRTCVDYDIDFHKALARASKNHVLADMFTVFADVLRSSLYQLRQSEAAVDYDKVQVGHLKLYDAVKNRDPREAAACAEEYLGEIGRHL